MGRGIVWTDEWRNERSSISQTQYGRLGQGKTVVGSSSEVN